MRVPIEIEQKIIDSLDIEDALKDIGVVLSRTGVNLTAHNPFRDDRHIGSFVINKQGNYAKDFATGETYSPIDVIIKGKQMDYGTALRYAAAMYGIYIDNNPVPTVNKCSPRNITPELELKTYDISLAKMYDNNQEHNPLLCHLAHDIPMAKEDLNRLCESMLLYHVGTSTAPDTQWWTIWWYIDEMKRVRDGKLMKYKEDGHRDKDSKYNFNWIHTLMHRAHLLDNTKYRTETCLFGLHLIDMYENPEVCIVESEKSALICSAFTRRDDQRIWMATGGKSGLNIQKLQPIIRRNISIVVYPDIDGYDEWTEYVERVKKVYNHISISQKVKDLWIPEDGEKADIADIMLRKAIEANAEPPRGETQADRIARYLGESNKAEDVDRIINQLELIEQ